MDEPAHGQCVLQARAMDPHAPTRTLRCLAMSSPCRLYTVLVLYSLPPSDSGCDPASASLTRSAARPRVVVTSDAPQHTADQVDAGGAGCLAERGGRRAGNRLGVLGEELGPVRRVEALLGPFSPAR